MQGVIFDLDGTLIDSMWIWEKVDREVLESFGHTLDKEYIKETQKMNFSQCTTYIKNRFNLPITYMELEAILKEAAAKEYRQIKTLIPGAKEYIYHLKERGVKIGLATSCLRSLCEEVLENCGVLGAFDAFVYSDEFGKNKTEPDMYIRTAQLLEVKAEDIIVFEDLAIAAQSAQKAGMRAVGVGFVLNKKQKEILQGVCYHYIDDFCAVYTKEFQERLNV